MSLVLRHKPEEANITLDSEGWASVSDLLKGMKARNHILTREELNELVAQDAKGRYSFSEYGKKIRANQGHSNKDVEIKFEQLTPPDLLYHGTATANIDPIMDKGILRIKRHHVHLSADKGTARTVGARHGKPVVLTIDAKRMQEDGALFYLSENGIWLTGIVMPRYIIDMDYSVT